MNVYDTSLWIKNLAPFTGGVDESTTIYATNDDKVKALSFARATLDMKARRSLCDETSTQHDLALTALWSCRLAQSYRGKQVLSVQRVGNSAQLEVEF